MHKEMLSGLRQEMLLTLEQNILPFWLHHMVDGAHGGFYGRMTGEGRLMPDAPKGAILNARILWSFAAAYRVLGNGEYLLAARRAKDYILRHFIDRTFGGTFWEVDCEGRPTDTKKQFYAIGFMLYGLSEYARALYHRLGNAASEETETVLQECFSLFDVIEHHARDQRYGGYIEALSRDWQPLADVRLSEVDANFPKSQNTHLHIIEPYANFVRCLKEMHRSVERVEPALRHLIDIFCHRILNASTWHLDLFFEMDWTRGAGHLESYGHDIECSWLLHEAALVLDDAEVLAQVEPIVQRVAEASVKGINADGSMTHEANLDTGYVDADRHWWVQAEAVVGFLNIYQHFHTDSALERALRCWDYIKAHLIDRELGEWFWSCDAEGHVNRREDHAGFWKCPYHNSRMCLEIIQRFPAGA